MSHQQPLHNLTAYYPANTFISRTDDPRTPQPYQLPPKDSRRGSGNRSYDDEVDDLYTIEPGNDIHFSLTQQGTYDAPPVYNAAHETLGSNHANAVTQSVKLADTKVTARLCPQGRHLYMFDIIDPKNSNKKRVMRITTQDFPDFVVVDETDPAKPMDIDPFFTPDEDEEPIPPPGFHPPLMYLVVHPRHYAFGRRDAHGKWVADQAFILDWPPVQDEPAGSISKRKT